jgi:hypothetical protein
LPVKACANQTQDDKSQYEPQKKEDGIRQPVADAFDAIQHPASDGHVLFPGSVQISGQ